MRTRLRDAAVSINQHCMGRVPAVTENEPRGSRTRRNGMPLTSDTKPVPSAAALPNTPFDPELLKADVAAKDHIL